ncbi:MAG: 2-isopropylmalate synthase, partial [Phenylobacterium sp.]|nr:2-isopropylmalate synthase [Phenylobacterium sp.]
MTSQASTAASERDRVIIFDTTMRDGEQSPGASMSLEEKLELAKILEEMRVDVIEAGFPIASNGDFEAVRQISEIVTESTVCGLARAAAIDIERCAEAIRPAKRGRIHTFLSTSPSHRDHILKMSQEDILEAITRSVTHARNLCDDVEWSAQDATRTEQDFLRRCVEAAIKAGAKTVNIPDTVGYSYPSEYEAIFRDLVENVPGVENIILSTHCHNDLGLAVANSLAGVQGGARQVEVAVNGIGERAGNAALEEVVMALKVRGDRLPYFTGAETQHITRASRYVSAITGFPVQFNKAIVGKNAFAHESGIHQDGMLKDRGTYEIMTPESVGQGGSNLVMGKHSGRHAFREKLKALGYELGQNALNEAFQRFKDLADKKKHVFDDDIVALVDDALA